MVPTFMSAPIPPPGSASKSTPMSAESRAIMLLDQSPKERVLLPWTGSSGAYVFFTSFSLTKQTLFVSRRCRRDVRLRCVKQPTHSSMLLGGPLSRFFHANLGVGGVRGNLFSQAFLANTFLHGGKGILRRHGADLERRGALVDEIKSTQSSICFGKRLD